MEPPAAFVTRCDDRWFGRFRLRFAQVSPWPDLHGAFARVRTGWHPLVEETLSAAATEMPQQVRPVHLLNQGIHGRGWEVDRWTVEGEAWIGFPVLCAELAHNRAGEEDFGRFVTFLSDR
ncbi:hypothetical protein ACFVFH_15255 [Streptomyces sp. NPDC057697]|uniref:hypothetical protein n=1 Tax=Streptomyces sp. NPDC057697 TaxID=3346219 RepID=UPI003677854C